jgi:hypothetical protein
LCDIIPPPLLQLLSWSELQERICGSSRDIDLTLLQRHTEYASGVDRNAPYITWFWNTLKGFSSEQRRRFVRFAYAQERLPSTDQG